MTSFRIAARWAKTAKLNTAMARKLTTGEARDVSPYRTQTGRYELPPGFEFEDVDLCDAERGLWIWSVGRERTSARRTFASTSAEFYQNADYDCLWLR